MTQALSHPLKQAFSADGYPWLLAQVYAALGLGTTGDKMKTYRAQLEPGRDWLEWRDPAHNNSKRVCYTQSGVSAIAHKLNTPKALEFARLVSQHRAANDNPGALIVAQSGAVTPIDTTYRLARSEQGELQRMEPVSQPLHVAAWQQVSGDQGGQVATIKGLQSEAMRVGLPDRVDGNVIINQGTINHYTVHKSEGQGLPALSRQTWERVSIGLLFTCIAVPVFFLALYITSTGSRNDASTYPVYQNR